MKFFISKTKKLKNKFGDWYFWHDEKVKIQKNSDYVILYHGYTINDAIENCLNNFDHLQQQDGNFFAVKITQSNLEAITDTFCQNKIFYRPNEVTNSIYLFPFTPSDIDKKELLMRADHPTIEEWGEDAGPTSYRAYIWQKYPEHKRIQNRLHNPETCTTIFKDTFLLQPDHKLIHNGEFQVVRVYNTPKQIQTSLRNTKVPSDNIEEKIYERMKKHANVISKNYTNVYSSVSEGIDSVLQDSFFPSATSVYYDFIPNNVPEQYKKIIQSQSQKKFKHDSMPLQPLNEFENVVSTSMNDPTCCFLDTLPSHWQMKKYNDADILLFGQCADQMFMHTPWFYYELTYCNIRHFTNDPTEIEQKFNETLEKEQNCYAVKENFRRKVKLTYQEVFKEPVENSLSETHTSYSNDNAIPRKALPGLYNRDIAHAIDKPVTSLYADKDLYFLIHSLPFDQMLDNVKNITIQKNILKNKFNKNFQTPYKDAASFLTIPIINLYYKHTVSYCLADHLSELEA